MTTKKKLVFTTCILSVFSIIMAIFFNYVFHFEFWTNFSFAIFGSALLGFIMSLVEYRVERKRALEEYYLNSSKLINIFSKAKYFISIAPSELLINYYNELANSNPMFNANDNSSAKEDLFEFMHNIWINTIDIPEPDFSDFEKQEFDKFTENIKKELIETVSSYITISETDLSQLEMAYGNLDFLFGNRKLRAKVFSDIHKPLQEYKKYIDEKVYHFRGFMNSQYNNFGVIIKLIDDIQLKYFKIINTSDEYMFRITVYKDFLDKITDNTNWLKCKIYHQNHSEDKHTPLIGYQEMLKLKSIIVKNVR